MHISNWSAHRSGAAITIKGTTDLDGSTVRLREIVKIEVRSDIVVAIERGGDEHILRVGVGK